MNVKFSQLPILEEAAQNMSFPILYENKNYMMPLDALYNFISGDRIFEIYAVFNSVSAHLLSSARLAQSVYTSYNTASASYFLVTDPRIAKWESNFSTTNSISAGAVNTTNYIRSVSSVFCFSDITNIPGAIAIKNMVAITQANYDALTFIDPETYYVIIS